MTPYSTACFFLIHPPSLFSTSSTYKVPTLTSSSCKVLYSCAFLARFSIILAWFFLFQGLLLFPHQATQLMGVSGMIISCVLFFVCVDVDHHHQRSLSSQIYYTVFPLLSISISHLYPSVLIHPSLSIPLCLYLSIFTCLCMVPAKLVQTSYSNVTKFLRGHTSTSLPRSLTSAPPTLLHLL